MKTAINRKDSKKVGDHQPHAVTDSKPPIKLLVWREPVVAIREPEPPRFIERTFDFGHWGINE
jgi:hypothetical protein